MTGRIRLVNFFALFVFASVLSANPPKPTLVLGIHPYLNKNEIIKRFTPLTEHLSQELNQQVVLKIASSYQQHIDYIGNDQVDIAFMGPEPYVEMVRHHGVKPILARLEVNGKPYFRGKIFTHKNSAINTIYDLSGKDVAFGQPTSTMSSVVPIWTLKTNEIDLSILNSYQHLNNHENVALSVLMGDFDVGAAKEEVFQAYKGKGLKEIHTTIAISEHLFITNNYLPKKTIKNIQNILFKLKDTQNGKKILQAIKPAITGMVPATDADYDSLRKLRVDNNRHLF